MEGYFESQAYGSVTSDRTLAKLDMPRMDAETLTKTLEGINTQINVLKFIYSNIFVVSYKNSLPVIFR